MAPTIEAATEAAAESEAAGVGTSGKGAKREREGDAAKESKETSAKPRVKKEKKEAKETAKTKPKTEPRTPSVTLSTKKERKEEKVPAAIKVNALKVNSSKKEPRPLNSLAANGPVTPADRGDVKRPTSMPGSSSGKKSRLGSESDLLDGLAAVPFALVSNSRRKSRPKKAPHN